MRDAVPCDSCGAPVVWRRHERTGKLAPIDAAPVPDGNVVLYEGGRYAIAPEATWIARPDLPRYRSHYVSCPQAEEWRKRGR